MMREVKTFKAEDGKAGFSPAELVRILTPAADGGWTVKITQGFRGQVLQVQLTQGPGPGVE